MYIEGYKLVSSFCRANPYGGSCILVRDELESSVKRRHDLTQHSIEKHVEISAVSFPRSKLTVVCLYRSPDGNFDVFIDALNEVLRGLVKQNYHIKVAGDFNVDFLKSSHQSHTLQDLFLSHNLAPTVREITRLSPSGGSCLDNILTNLPSSKYQVQVLDTSLSDHKGQIMLSSIVLSTAQPLPSKTKFRSFSKNNKLLFKSFLASEEWHSVYTEMNVELAFEKFINIITSHFNNSFKFQSKNNLKQNRPQWLTAEVIASRERLKDAFLLQRSGQPELTNYYKQLKSNHYLLVKETKSRQAKDTIKNSKNPVKATWKLINQFRPGGGCGERVEWAIDHNGSKTQNPQTISDLFNSHLLLLLFTYGPSRTTRDTINAVLTSWPFFVPILVSFFQNALFFYHQTILLHFFLQPLSDQLSSQKPFV